MMENSEKKYVTVSQLSKELGASPYMIRQKATQGNRGKGIVVQLGERSNSKWLIDYEQFMRRWNKDLKKGVRVAL